MIIGAELLNKLSDITDMGLTLWFHDISVSWSFSHPVQGFKRDRDISCQPESILR